MRAPSRKSALPVAWACRCGGPVHSSCPLFLPTPCPRLPDDCLSWFDLLRPHHRGRPPHYNAFPKPTYVLPQPQRTRCVLNQDPPAIPRAHATSLLRVKFDLPFTLHASCLLNAFHCPCKVFFVDGHERRRRCDGSAVAVAGRTSARSSHCYAPQRAHNTDSASCKPPCSAVDQRPAGGPAGGSACRWRPLERFCWRLGSCWEW